MSGEKGHLFSGVWRESTNFWDLGSREQEPEGNHLRERSWGVGSVFFFFLFGNKELTSQVRWVLPSSRYKKVLFDFYYRSR